MIERGVLPGAVAKVISPYTGKEVGLSIQIICAACGIVIGHNHTGTQRLPVAKVCKCGNMSFVIRYRGEEKI